MSKDNYNRRQHRQRRSRHLSISLFLVFVIFNFSIFLSRVSCKINCDISYHHSRNKIFTKRSQVSSNRNRREWIAVKVGGGGGSSVISTESTQVEARIGVHSYSPRPEIYYDAEEKEEMKLGKDLQLEQVITIIRHGDRAPIERTLGTVIADNDENKAYWLSKLPSDETLDNLYKTFPLINPSMITLDDGEKPYSQLTARGNKEHIKLGEHLRERYINKMNFLPKSLLTKNDVDSFFVRCTNMRRTAQSAQSLLSGLYPSSTITDSSNQVQREKIMIHVKPNSEETMYPPKHCEKLTDLVRQMNKNNYGCSYSEKKFIDDLHDRVKNVFGLDKISWQKVRDVLTCYLVYNRKYPIGVDQDFLHNIITMASKMWANWFYDDQICRLSIGRFLGELISVMPLSCQNMKKDDNQVSDNKKKKKNKGYKKFLLFSGHDSTIVPILCSMGIYQNIWPPYASNIIFEIAKTVNTKMSDKGKYYIRVVYNDRVQKLSFSGTSSSKSSSWCPLEKFYENWEHLIPKDFEKDCILDTNEYTRTYDDDDDRL